MGIRDTIKNLLGKAWHVQGDAVVDALLPETDGTVEASKPITANATGGVTFPNSANIAFGTTTGTKIGTATTQKLSFYNATPIVQPSGATQAAVATTAITTASTTTTPAGYATTTQADNVAAIADANRTLLNQLRSDLVTLGLIKGAA